MEITIIICFTIVVLYILAKVFNSTSTNSYRRSPGDMYKRNREIKEEAVQADLLVLVELFRDCEWAIFFVEETGLHLWSQTSLPLAKALTELNSLRTNVNNQEYRFVILPVFLNE
jgi:hypothetical protein